MTVAGSKVRAVSVTATKAAFPCGRILYPPTGSPSGGRRATPVFAHAPRSAREHPMTLPTTQLGRTGLSVTRVGLGAWAIGGGGWQGGWGPQDDDESVRAIHHAVAGRGINWIDTAAAYGLGHAEEVVGRAVAELRETERPYVFTKCGLVWEPGGTTVRNTLAP